MELNEAEINELIYAIGIAKRNGILVNMHILNEVEDKLRNELEKAES